VWTVDDNESSKHSVKTSDMSRNSASK